MASLFTRVLVLMTLTPVVQGHGFLLSPPGRSSLWRVGLSDQANYNDKELFCGGFNHQYAVNGGKCGLCGDPFDQPTPRDNENGGTYGKGIIAGTYLEGQQIDIDVQITAHHKGWFEYKLCPYVPATEECFAVNLLVLTSQVNGGTRYQLPDTGSGLYNVTVQLPAGVSCTQCVLQWRYHTGNSWGVDPDGTGCVGCGDQEEFYGCADIAITPVNGDDTSSTTTTDTATTTTTSTTPSTTTTSAAGGCFPVGPWAVVPGMTVWCNQNCPGYCPPSYCACS